MYKSGRRKCGTMRREREREKEEEDCKGRTELEVKKRLSSGGERKG